MNQVAKKSKIIWISIIAVVLVGLAIAVYYYQTGNLKLSADQPAVYSQVCISGIVDGEDTRRCFSTRDDTFISDDLIKLKNGEDYTIEYIQGNYRPDDPPLFNVC